MQELVAVKPDFVQFIHQAIRPIQASLLTQEREDDTDTITDEPYKVVLFNDDYHTFEEVINQLMKAIRCGREKAEAYTWEVHTKGKAIVFDGGMEECLRVSAILEEIHLKTEIQTC
ncbi:MAG: ATP-dependent Clp protease adaptor ClpS [Chloroherpetonaceae bacterium]|nr:ATP-dependent Clp protease adaptor ClpS [Chloroherpetonaceae bacterium]MCS7211471.1 ATP-dependent Clp protease adaptor ClpS [Chloroherpetonaceae bacterium]MDW8019937.1 ATP-dependent Clp protease adaptor ClpS [Chloroherpetonaceae bacterium]MDW8465754.1 ATP-dependent Clp protease adaptor ClpS [Chloroherpetonaceae bacterium]